MPKYNWKINFSLPVILILLLSGRGLLARAATIEKLEIESGSKKISVTGYCVGQGAAVQISFATSNQPFYTAGADCDENKFEFKDDLGYWKIPDGDYNIAIIDKDDNPVNSSTATFKIQSATPTVSDKNIVEPIVDLENSSVSAQENDAIKTEIANQGEANGLFTQIINFLAEWFKSAIVIIKELIVEKVTTPELCLGNTCIIEDQLKNLLGGKQKIEPLKREPEVMSTSSDTIINITN